MNHLTRITSVHITKQISILTSSSSRSSCPALLKRDNSTQTAEVPLDLPAPGKEKIYSDKLKQIVTDISKLTLLEVADLNELLKKTLKIPDAPMLSMAAAMPAAGNQSAATAKEEEDEPEIVKSAYIVKMMKFDPAKKVQLIKEIKGIVEGMNLVQAKKFVESVPQVIKTECPKDEAEKLKTQLEAAGATIMLV